MASPVYTGAANFSHLHATVELEFSLQIPAADGAVAVVRDGKGAQVATATGTAGVYTVTFNDRVRMPRQLTSFGVSVSQPSNTATFNGVNLVTDSLNVSARTVQFVCYNGATNTIGRPPTGVWVSMKLRGPVRDDIKDPA